MNGRMFCFMLVMIISSSSALAFTDSLWIVGAEGYAGDLVTVEVWLQFEGSGSGDSISAFVILLTWDADVCTVEAIAPGQDFEEANWWFPQLQIDNEGTDGPPSVPKIGVGAYQCNPPIGCPFVEPGTHLAVTYSQ